MVDDVWPTSFNHYRTLSITIKLKDFFVWVVFVSWWLNFQSIYKNLFAAKISIIEMRWAKKFSTIPQTSFMDISVHDFFCIDGFIMNNVVFDTRLMTANDVKDTFFQKTRCLTMFSLNNICLLIKLSIFFYSIWILSGYFETCQYINWWCVMVQILL